MRLPIKPRMCHPAIVRAPWRFLEGLHGVSVVGTEVVWEYEARGVLPSLWSPGHSGVDVHQNLASLVDDKGRLPLVAATLGPLKAEMYKPGHREPLTLWMDAAKQMYDAWQMLERGDLDALSDLVTVNVFEHGHAQAFGDRDDWHYIFDDLIGVGWFELAEDMFAVIADKPRTYAECPVCTRWFRMVRKDQKQCSAACTSRAHRDRKDEA